MIISLKAMNANQRREYAESLLSFDKMEEQAESECVVISEELERLKTLRLGAIDYVEQMTHYVYDR